MKVTVTYYAERVNGQVRYFKENRDAFDHERISKIEIEKWEYEWATKR